MTKAVTEARRTDATAGTDPIYRSLFDSFNPDKDGRISPLEVGSAQRPAGRPRRTVASTVNTSTVTAGPSADY
jgi:hypothetical protein